MTVVAQLQQVSRIYRMGDAVVRALDRVTLSIPSGEYVAIMGQSGSGKSTMLNILGCLDRPTEGTYVLDGHDVSTLGDDALSKMRNLLLGFVFQSYNLIPHLTVLENIEVPLGYAGISTREARERAADLAARMGLESRMRHRPNELSGGQQQRVAIARSLANRPRLLLGDEPTGNLDSTTGCEILDLLDELNEEGVTVVLVTHDSGVAARARRILHMTDGRIDRIEVPS